MMSVVETGAEVEESNERLWRLIRDYMAAYAERRPVRTVAVVGNAPLGPDVGRASKLNSSDLVIRVNSLVLDEPGAAPTVGHTCHVVLLNRSTRLTPWVFQNYRRRAYLFMQAGFTIFRTVRPPATHWPADLGGMPVPNSIVTKRLGDLLLPGRQVNQLVPTTGMTGLFLAHEMFPDAQMLATGFSFLKDRQQQEWEHHAGGTVPVEPRHNLALEGALLESWLDDGSMEFLD